MVIPEAFGYCWHRNTGQWYYGIHLGDIEDDYAGSGTKFMRLYGGQKKQDCYAPLDWHRTIEFRGTYKECDKWEKDMVTLQMIEHPLCLNLKTGGGNGRPGKEQRAKISATMTGQKETAERSAKKKGNTRAKGYKHTAETKAKLSAASKGKTPSAETRAKMSTARKGTTQSAETRAKIGAAMKGRKHTAESIAKMSAAKIGKPVSAEARAKLSAASKEMWRKRREDELNNENL